MRPPYRSRTLRDRIADFACPFVITAFVLNAGVPFGLAGAQPPAAVTLPSEAELPRADSRPTPRPAGPAAATDGSAPRSRPGELPDETVSLDEWRSRSQATRPVTTQSLPAESTLPSPAADAALPRASPPGDAAANPAASGRRAVDRRDISQSPCRTEQDAAIPSLNRG